MQLRLTRDGRCLDADEAACTLVGYSLAELRKLSPGSLWRSVSEPGVPGTGEYAAVSGRLDILRAKNGDHLAIHVEALEPDGDSVTLTFRVAGGRPIPLNRRGVPRSILSRWRTLERRLEASEPTHPQWATMERHIEDLRELYQHASQHEAAMRADEARAASPAEEPPGDDRLAG